MDSRRFDALTRALSAPDVSRRQVVRGLVAGIVGGLLGQLGRSAGTQDACTSASDCAGDGDPCTAVDCVGGQCVHSPVVCDPGLVCVDAECVPDDGPGAYSSAAESR